MSSFRKLEAERAALVASANEARAKRLAAIADEQRATAAAHAEAVSGADSAFTAEIQNRKVALVAALHAELDPLLQAFVLEDSRSIAASILACWSRHVAAAEEQVGEKPTYQQILFGLAKAKFPDDEDRLGSNVLFEQVYADRIAAATDGASCRAALLDLEAVLSRRWPGCQPIAGRFSMLRGALSQGDQGAAIEKWDRDRAAERQAEFAKKMAATSLSSAEPPAGDSSRNSSQPVVRDFLSRVADGARQGWYGQ